MIGTDSDRREVRVTPPREIDIATGSTLAIDIGRACEQGPDIMIVVDFTGVTFCDSTAVRVLIHALRRLEDHGCHMDVRNPSILLRRVATVLDATQVLGIEPSAWLKDAAS